MPLFPQLRLVLRAYDALQPDRERTQLLTFTHAGRGRMGDEIPIRDSRKLLDAAIARAADMLDESGIEHELREKRIVPRSWRPTYCTVRIQTTEDGVPVAPHTVMLEMGHESLSMINKVYNRLGKVRPARRPFVGYELPDGSFPGEELVREILGGAEVDAVLRQAEAALDSSSDQDPPPLRLVK